MNRQPRVNRLGGLGGVDDAKHLAGGLPRANTIELYPLLFLVQELKECHHYSMYVGQLKMNLEDR